MMALSFYNQKIEFFSTSKMWAEKLGEVCGLANII